MAISESALEHRRNGTALGNPKGLYIMKFGGTSVGGVKAIEKVAGIVGEHRSQGKKIIVVVSAVRGVTDALLRVCDLITEQKESDVELALEDIYARHETIIDDLSLRFPLKAALNRQFNTLMGNLWSDCIPCGTMTPERKDKIAAHGEKTNAPIVAAKLEQHGVTTEVIDATDIIETDNNFGNATPNFEKTRIYAKRRILPLLEQGITPVVPGFIGATKDYKTTTLGRGGSDYTAAILGFVLDANQVWIWTDVDGVYSADPRNNPEAHVIPRLSYLEAEKMARNGAKVLYVRTMGPLMGTEVTMRVKNTFNPDHPGTEISN